MANFTGIEQDRHKKVSLADGLSVYTPALTLDEKTKTLVYLEMVGAKQLVRANWAALMGKGQSHWVGRQQIALDGMKVHVNLQSRLPCGCCPTGQIAYGSAADKKA